MFATLAVCIADSHGAEPAAPPSTAAAAFDPDSVPVSTRPLPAFPYLEWPSGVPSGERRSKQQDFDLAWFVAGAAPHAAEGRVDRRHYWLKRAGMSKLEATRNYEIALKELGAVRVDTMHPSNKNFPAKNSPARHAFVTNKLGLNGNGITYATYLVRTADKRVWIGLGITDAQVNITTLEEKKMDRSIRLTKADEMKTALDKQGFIALYINFDTDKAALREDGKPTVAEIARLLKDNRGLKISVEGHTDNSGDARRNKILSEQRAAAIVAALKASGIEAARLKSAGFGADRPIADNRTDEGRASNRRVELVKG
ncbi:OmpA family protein [Pseudoduganella dura]|nr:OmpA family protein [Pseudoduganella dura]